MIRLASALLEAGAAYESEGHVYFRGASVPDDLGLDRDARSPPRGSTATRTTSPGREDVFDVAVWRPSPEDHPAWPSPWGWGRPGWHAECAAMAVSALGSAVDVLIGGADLAFPHHAYQAAMAQTATQVRPFARAVLRVGEVRHEGSKMAKSTGNLVLVRDLLERHDPAAIRLGSAAPPLGRAVGLHRVRVRRTRAPAWTSCAEPRSDPTSRRRRRAPAAR